MRDSDEIEAGEFAHRRQIPLPPEEIERRDLLELNDRLQGSIARQSARLVDEYWRERDFPTLNQTEGTS